MSDYGLKLSREQVYIISSIDYYGYATITKDLKSKLWLDALDLEDMGYIKAKNINFSSAIFIGTDKIYDLPIEFKNKRII
jgi:hypothetical protein